MTHSSLERLLGTNDRDPGCDGAFEVLDQYVDALRRGDPVAQGYADFLTHLRHCAACREDTEGLRMVLDSLDGVGPVR